jgi:superfamily II DNA/RNA helicase
MLISTVLPYIPYYSSIPLLLYLQGLKDWLCDVCRAMGYRKPFPIQQHCIPAILRRKDVMGCAETGSGKRIVALVLVD